MKITVSTLSLFWMVQLTIVAASPVLTPLDNQEAPSTQEIQLQAHPMGQTTPPSRGSLDRLANETFQKILDHIDIDTIPELMKMKRLLPSVGDYSLEYDSLAQDEKDPLIDIFKFEFNLGYYPSGDSTDDEDDHFIDSKLAEISDAYQKQPLPEITEAIKAYVKAEQIAGTHWEVVELLELTRYERYVMSPMLGLAADGNIDLVLELQNLLASYSGSASFKKACNQVWAPEKQVLFDAAENAYGIEDSFESTAPQTEVVQLATIFTLASVKDWDNLIEYLKRQWATWAEADWFLIIPSFMLMLENGPYPLHYDFYQGSEMNADFVRQVQLCAEKYGFSRTKDEFAEKWENMRSDLEAANRPIPDLEHCPYDILGNKIRYDTVRNTVAFVVDKYILRKALGDQLGTMRGDSVLAGPIPEVLINTPNARLMQSTLDSV
ncbi:hypothetical protein H4R33_005217 [Dimargaris cristalligena]|nr:hypothetical protein H4R33_005217 [Dimargaris cristalligena]